MEMLNKVFGTSIVNVSQGDATNLPQLSFIYSFSLHSPYRVFSLELKSWENVKVDRLCESIVLLQELFWDSLSSDSAFLHCSRMK